MRITWQATEALIDSVETLLIAKYGAENVRVASAIKSNDACGCSWCSFSIKGSLGSREFIGDTKRELFQKVESFKQGLEVEDAEA